MQTEQTFVDYWSTNFDYKNFIIWRVHNNIESLNVWKLRLKCNYINQKLLFCMFRNISYANVSDAKDISF